MNDVDNILTIDWWWDEQEYGIPSRRRLRRQREAYEEEEREDREYDVIRDYRRLSPLDGNVGR